jgi:geranylgeranyl reductase family protein
MSAATLDAGCALRGPAAKGTALVMDSCDVLIVGGGPAGSSCAWKLRCSGLDVAILDRATFPRNKVCGGWITPAVLDELEIDPAAYARAHVLQPITGFRTGGIGGAAVATDYGKPVSYGIRRYEFDDYLLKRSGARLMQGEALTSLERSGDSWIVNGRMRTALVVGAGGHFCPVARFMGAKFGSETIVAAQEIEFEMDACQRSRCAVRSEIPELYFCADMKGYGWCFRKGNILNVGLGRLDKHQLSRHVAEFLDFLNAINRLSFELPVALPGHAYLLYGRTTRNVVGDGMLLIGDAAGLAFSQSGEGIRPAIESGLLAAKVIATAHGYSRQQLAAYRTLLTERFGKSGDHWVTKIGSRLPQGWINSAARQLLANSWFTREMILNRWFLRTHEPALAR